MWSLEAAARPQLRSAFSPASPICAVEVGASEAPSHVYRGAVCVVMEGDGVDELFLPMSSDDVRLRSRSGAGARGDGESELGFGCVQSCITISSRAIGTQVDNNTHIEQ